MQHVAHRTSDEVAQLQRRVQELETALSAMVDRFSLYAGPDSVYAGYHDKQLLRLARAALAGKEEG